MFVQRLSAVIAAFLVLTSLNALSAEPGPNLSAPEAYALVEAGNMTLIDIRRPEEWRQTGVAKDARRINMEHPDGLIAFLRQIAVEVKGDANAPIGLICRTGNRTTQIQKVMQEVGFTNVYNIKEGMIGSAAGPGWKTRGLPVEPCPNC
ncbi:MAG: rhodanese-like domain-containing protein [Sulfuriferula multivorans]|uniref:Rhodanese-like domain-containing protein n=1 Tax=Sulfuriferula multivorans TaxID=1559896 RepID=A0A7C9P8T5_9PROT|nr:rhodanese-like domain-containing protein [Sulfuriferula multivorans]